MVLGHSSPNDFGPGYAYAYLDLTDNHVHSGVVTQAIETNLNVVSILGTLDRVRLVVNAGSGAANELGAFVTTDLSRTAYMPGQTTNRIIYGQFDSAGDNFEILQVEPAVASESELQTLFGVSSTSDRENVNIPLPQILGLDETQMTSGQVDSWALTANPDERIPDNKLPADVPFTAVSCCYSYCRSYR